MTRSRFPTPLRGGCPAVATLWLAAFVLPSTVPAGAPVFGFRGDAQRRGVVARPLKLPLAKKWEVETAAPQPAWPERSPKLSFDWLPVPVTDGKRVYLSSSARSALDAFELTTGLRQWTFYADGPIRFAPLIVGDRIYLVSDDGYLYCLNASTGKPIWRVPGAPSHRIVLGNEHYISAYPARGAPVFHEGVIYFSAGIWPWMGIFLHAVDAESGATIWTNSGEGEKYIRQQHNSPAFAGIAPQGYLATDGRTLIVPGGLSVPGLYDAQTGESIFFDPSSRTLGKSAGGYDVMMGTDYYVNRDGLYELSTGRPITRIHCDVVTEDAAYGIDDGELVCLDPRLQQVKREVRDRRGNKKTDTTTTLPERWRAALGGKEPRILGIAGRLLIVARDNTVELLEYADGRLHTRWKADLGEGAGWADCRDGWLVVSTRSGRLIGFAEAGVASSSTPSAATPSTDDPVAPAPPPPPTITAADVAGHGIVLGEIAPEWIGGLLERTKLRWTVFTADRRSASQLARRLDRFGLLGVRCSVRSWDSSASLPPYTARAVIVVFPELVGSDTRASQVVQAVRPYGGELWILGDSQTSLMEQAIGRLEGEAWPDRRTSAWRKWTRPGPLPGAGRWTHQTGNAANTLVSPETRVRLPLGILWYGGPSNREVLPRHGHGPTPQVLGGRIVIEGPDMLRAIDVYSGVLLWQVSFPGIGEFYDTTSHHPGAGAIGGNYVMAPDAIYVIYRRACHVLDPETGKEKARWQLPRGRSGKPPHWGWLSWVDDVLLATAQPIVPLTGRSSRDPSSLDEEVPYAEGSRFLYALDRHSGRVLWKREAVWNFRHNAIAAGGGKVFCIDGMTAARRRYLARRGLPSDAAPTLYALELKTGRPIWSRSEGVFGTWLAYDERGNVLLEAGSHNRDRAKDEAGRGMALYDADTGSPLWRHDQAYAGPPLLYSDRIVAQGTAFDIETGRSWQRRHPLTGESVDWFFRKNYGCDTAIGCPTLLTFRSAAAGFFDLAADGGTGNFGGFRTSCTATLIPADGVIASPDYTRTCLCSYQQRTSLALVPVHELPYWTFLGAKKWSGKRIERLGVNFGAPGDRREPDGTLWLEYPVVGGDSPDVPIRVEGDLLRVVRHHPLRVDGSDNWIASSGMEGVRQVSIPLVGEGRESSGPVAYRVELWFAELGEAERGERVFRLRVGKKLLRVALDVRAAAGGAMRSLKVDAGIHRLERELKIELQSSDDAIYEPVLCGVKLTRVADDGGGEPGR